MRKLIIALMFVLFINSFVASLNYENYSEKQRNSENINEVLKNNSSDSELLSWLLIFLLAIIIFNCCFNWAFRLYQLKLEKNKQRKENRIRNTFPIPNGQRIFLPNENGYLVKNPNYVETCVLNKNPLARFQNSNNNIIKLQRDRTLDYVKFVVDCTSKFSAFLKRYNNGDKISDCLKHINLFSLINTLLVCDIISHSTGLYLEEFFSFISYMLDISFNTYELTIKYLEVDKMEDNKERNKLNAKFEKLEEAIKMQINS